MRGSVNKKGVPKHKVFISFHEEDMKYKDRFVQKAKNVIIDKSVDTGDIDDKSRKTDTIRQIIRDEYIRDATVTIVLIGPKTWQRKHVDWEIGSSLRATKLNSRCGLLGILLPNHPNYEQKELNLRLVPPRLADNCNGQDPYALIYHWPKNRAEARLREWVHRAFVRREGKSPDNSKKPFARNRTTDYLKGWQN